MIEKELKIAEAYAKIRNFKLNPDKHGLNFILKGLEENREKFGAPYCPCRVRTGNKEKDTLIICPCAYHLDEIKRDGHCLCKLFWKK